jgi:hypothetical protein
MRTWARWQDWVNVVVGAWLFITPWVYSTVFNVQSAWNAWLLGAAMLIVALWALAAPGSAAAEWINAVFGAWTFVAPWALSFSVLTAAAWNSWIVGAIVCILALWALTEQSRRPSGVTQAKS